MKETLEEFIEREGYPEGHTQDIWETGVRDGIAWQAEQNSWKSVSEETPPSNIELLVQSPEGIVHISSWRESYNIFSCQAKSESSFDWKWKTI